MLVSVCNTLHLFQQHEHCMAEFLFVYRLFQDEIQNVEFDWY
jgi:hypothetical protein